MGLAPEKKAFIALGAAALAVILLLPFVFRELEPDYNAAYSMDPAKRRRFAAKDEKAPELPNLPPSQSASVVTPVTGPELSTHRAPPAVGRARIASPDTPEASSAPGGGNATSVAGAGPRLVPGASGTMTAGTGTGSGAGAADGGATLEDARFGAHEGPREIKLDVVAGAADAARMADSLGLKSVAGLALAGSADLKANEACALASREIRPKLQTAIATHKQATDEFKASACPANSCGRHAADCVLKERTDEESRLARRRCACDKLACRRLETCRAVEKLTCEQTTACADGKSASCAPGC